MKDLMLIRGLPGSGKSTLAECIRMAWGGTDHWEADMFFIDSASTEYTFDRAKLGEAHDWCQKMAKGSLQLQRNVVVSNTFTTQKEMRPYLELAQQFKATVFIVECRGKFKSVHNVPQDAIDRMATRWEAVEN
jgi:predicted kinase